jgi:flagella synthesis protein FlgN
MTTPARSLPQEQVALARLVVKLREEQVLLAEAAADGMADLIGEKATIVSEMTTLAGHRHQMLAAIGYSEDEAGMQQWMSEHGTEADREIWAALFDLAQDAKELNRVNGVLIGKKLANNQSALTILQGKSGGGNFYGPDGQSNNKSSGRRLGVV